MAQPSPKQSASVESGPKEGESSSQSQGHKQQAGLKKSVDWGRAADDVALKVVGELPSLTSCLILPETVARKSQQRQIREAVGLQVVIFGGEESWRLYILSVECICISITLFCVCKKTSNYHCQQGTSRSKYTKT